MGEAEFMEDKIDYYSMYNDDPSDESENFKCQRETCVGCLCSDWCSFYHG